MPSRAWRAALVLLLPAASGCAPAPDPLLAISGPQSLVGFELRDADGVVLWAIEAERGQALRALRYGEVPPGFRQLAPPGGAAPRPLRHGEPLTAETRSEARRFVHQGHAAGDASLRIHASSMQLLEPPRPASEATPTLPATPRSR